MGAAADNPVVSAVRGLQADYVDEALAMRIGEALMANDDACIAFFHSDHVLVISAADGTVHGINAPLIEALIGDGRMFEIGLATVPPLLRRRGLRQLVFGRGSAIVSGSYSAAALRAQLPVADRKPVTAVKDIIDVI